MRPVSDVNVAQLRKRGGFTPGPAARHASDQNAKQDPIAVSMVCERHRGGLPPDRMLLKEVLGDTSRTSELGRVGKLLVSSEDDKRDPLCSTRNFIELETNKRILSHPLDFLTESGEAIEVVVEVDMNRNDVRLVVQRARQPTEVCLGEYCAALTNRSSPRLPWQVLI